MSQSAPTLSQAFWLSEGDFAGSTFRSFAGFSRSMTSVASAGVTLSLLRSEAPWMCVRRPRRRCRAEPKAERRCRFRRGTERRSPKTRSTARPRPFPAVRRSTTPQSIFASNNESGSGAPLCDRTPRSFAARERAGGQEGVAFPSGSSRWAGFRTATLHGNGAHRPQVLGQSKVAFLSHLTKARRPARELVNSASRASYSPARSTA